MGTFKTYIWVVLFGNFLECCVCFGMLILVFHPTLASRIVLFCVRLFDRMFKTDKEKSMENVLKERWKSTEMRQNFSIKI